MAEDILYPRFVEQRLTEALEDSPVVLIQGPRQCGTTTLAQMVCASENLAGEQRLSKQWQQGVGACLHQGLFRLLSWQDLLASLAEAPEFAYLIDNLGAKYGLEPN